MSRSRFCKICRNWHDSDEPWPEACLRHFRQNESSSIHIIKDIEPYQAVASDIAEGGKPPKIAGRRQHREFLRRNNYIEVGNERRPQKADYGPEVTEREVRQVYEQLRDQRR